VPFLDAESYIGHLVVIDPVLPIEGEVVVAGAEHNPAASWRGGQPVFFTLQFKTFFPDFLTAEFFCSLVLQPVGFAVGEDGI
jgi:hypothetical protein